MDRLTKTARSRNMSAIRSVNTKPELIVRKYLSSQGIRYRINLRIPGKPDIVFIKKKIAIFIHGCFWHQHHCIDGHIPKSNTRYWQKKLEKNQQRDVENIKRLAEMGWQTIVLWECEINKDPEKACVNVLHSLGMV